MGIDALTDDYYNSSQPLHKLQESIEAVDAFIKRNQHQTETIALAIQYRDHLITMREWRLQYTDKQRQKLNRKRLGPRHGWTPDTLSIKSDLITSEKDS